MAVTQGFGVFGLILADHNIAVTFNGKSVVQRTYFKANPTGTKCDLFQFIHKDLFTSIYIYKLFTRKFSVVFKLLS